MQQKKEGENLMSEIEKISFQMIANVGSANALYMEAVNEARNGNAEKAELLMKEGEEWYRNSHKVHADLIMQMAAGKEIPFNMILMHAEDQLMNSEVIKLMAEQTIGLYKKVLQMEEKIERLEER